MRMRTIDEGYKEITANDPNTSLSKSAWRRLITTGVIPSVCVGTKYLVNMDMAERFLTEGEHKDPIPSPSQGIIRRIEA